MATTLYLRATSTNNIGTFFDVSTSAGSSTTTTGVVNTTGSGTNIQWTQTAGGTLLEWVSGRSPSGGWTFAGSATILINALESAIQANAGPRLRLYRRSTAGSETEVTGSPWDKGVEFTTTNAAISWSFTPTSIAFAEDERLIIRVFITNVGTMGNSRTCTIKYDGTTANLADTNLLLTETVTFKAEGSLLLSATEAQDTSSITTTLSTSLSLAATEAQDTSAITVTGPSWNLSLAATEAQDTASVTTTLSTSLSLAATEAQDTSSIVLTLSDTVALAATEAQDIAAIDVTLGAGAISLSLAATEAQDTSSIALTLSDTVALAATEAQDAADITTTLSASLALAAVETQDTASINTTLSTSLSLAATETQDGAAFDVTVVNPGDCSLSATEAQDSSSFAVTLSTALSLAATEAQDTASFRLGGFSHSGVERLRLSNRARIPRAAAKAIIEDLCWRDGMQWFLSTHGSETSPQEQMAIFDALQAVPEARILLDVGYDLAAIYGLMDEVIADDDDEAVATLLGELV